MAALGNSGLPVWRKPFRAAQLHAAIADALAAPGG
jgi:hypothetical protein